MTEIWKEIDSFERYKISSYGRVMNANNYIMIPEKKKGGYRRVALRANNKTYRRYVHRLVAQAFIQNLNNYPEVNHKDENPSNNRVDNLEWVTHKQNLSYGVLSCSSRNASQWN